MPLTILAGSGTTLTRKESRWLVTSGHKAVKNEEDSQEIVFTGSRKQKAKWSAPDAERARTKIKGESIPVCSLQCANNVYIRIADTDLDMSPPFGDDLYDSNAPASTELVSAPTPLPCSSSVSASPLSASVSLLSV